MPISVQSKRKRKKFKALDAHQDYDPNSDLMTDEEHDEEHVSNDEQNETSKNTDNDYEEDDEQFTAPDWNCDDSNDFTYLNPNTKFPESWILLWIYKFQSRFRLSDVTINSLIAFFGQVLNDANSKRFHSFPTSFYNAKKLLQIEKIAKTCRMFKMQQIT